MSPEPTASPDERSSDAKSTSTPAKAARSGTGRDLFQIAPHPVEIVAFLDPGTEGVLGDLCVESGLAEEVESPDPVDRLGHARGLGQIQFPEPVDGRDH